MNQKLLYEIIAILFGGSFWVFYFVGFCFVFWFFFNSCTFIATHAKKKTSHSPGENIRNGIQHLHCFYSFISQSFGSNARDFLCISFCTKWIHSALLFSSYLKYKCPPHHKLPFTYKKKTCLVSYWNIYQTIWILILWSRETMEYSMETMEYGIWNNYSLTGMFKNKSKSKKTTSFSVSLVTIF